MLVKLANTNTIPLFLCGENTLIGLGSYFTPVDILQLKSIFQMKKNQLYKSEQKENIILSQNNFLATNLLLIDITILT